MYFRLKSKLSNLLTCVKSPFYNPLHPHKALHMHTGQSLPKKPPIILFVNVLIQKKNASGWQAIDTPDWTVVRNPTYYIFKNVLISMLRKSLILVSSATFSPENIAYVIPEYLSLITTKWGRFFIFRQRRLRSDCAFAQFDLSLRCLYV